LKELNSTAITTAPTVSFNEELKVDMSSKVCLNYLVVSFNEELKDKDYDTHQKARTGIL